MIWIDSWLNCVDQESPWKIVPKLRRTVVLGGHMTPKGIDSSSGNRHDATAPESRTPRWSRAMPELPLSIRSRRLGWCSGAAAVGNAPTSGRAGPRSRDDYEEV